MPSRSPRLAYLAEAKWTPTAAPGHPGGLLPAPPQADSRPPRENETSLGLEKSFEEALDPHSVFGLPSMGFPLRAGLELALRAYDGGV